MNDNVPKCSTIGDLRKLLRELPPLNPEDAMQFEKDLVEIRRSAGPDVYRWDEDEPETPK